jgi:hypothetical protein
MRQSHAWKLAAALLLASAYLALPRLLPPRVRVERHWGAGGVNWFGQGPGAAYLWAAGLLALLCLLRFAIARKARSPADAAAWCVLLLASLLPAVWLLVAFDWDNEAVSDLANWVGYPVALLGVPAAFACYDALTLSRPHAGWYAARSLLEVAVLVPLWAVVWVFVEFLLLGWVGP